MGTVKPGAMDERLEDDSGTGDIGARVEGVKVTAGPAGGGMADASPLAIDAAPSLPDPAAVRAARQAQKKKGKR